MGRWSCSESLHRRMVPTRSTGASSAPRFSRGYLLKEATRPYRPKRAHRTGIRTCEGFCLCAGQALLERCWADRRSECTCPSLVSSPISLRALKISCDATYGHPTGRWNLVPQNWLNSEYSWLHRTATRSKTLTDEQYVAGFVPCQSTPLNL
jgi:hypothetical protein